MSSRQTVIINFQTPDLLRRSVSSFRDVYPDERLELVDNGSADGSADVLRELASIHPESTGITIHPRNLYHGPAMHRAILDADAEHVFVLDSDTVTRRGGFLEHMSALLDGSDDVYAVGQRVFVDRRGFAAEDGFPVPVSAHMMIRRRMYTDLPPFEHHGLPVLRNCAAASDKGWQVAEFPVEQYVDHLGRGTAERFGYGLGWKSRLDYLLHRLGF
ncbi:MAG: glycosyltransferase [Rhodothermales bacterium]|nr:glycosyltransferase [Rhodothermales bacterium]